MFQVSVEKKNGGRDRSRHLAAYDNRLLSLCDADLLGSQTTLFSMVCPLKKKFGGGGGCTTAPLILTLATPVFKRGEPNRFHLHSRLPRPASGSSQKSNNTFSPTLSSSDLRQGVLASVRNRHFYRKCWMNTSVLLSAGAAAAAAAVRQASLDTGWRGGVEWIIVSTSELCVWGVGRESPVSERDL